MSAGETVTYKQLCRAIADTLKGVRNSYTPNPVVVQNYDEITEGVNDWPLIRVLPKDGHTDAFASNTERSSFGGKIQTTAATVELICYARPRAELSEDIAAQIALLDGIDAVLGSQTVKPQFGLQVVQAFNWKWERVTLQQGTGDSVIQYAGLTITLELFIF